MEYVARLRHLKSSAQKTRLVADLIRGRAVESALQILRTTPKAVSKDIEILLRSAVANAEQRNPGIDVDALFVSRVFVDGGAMEKRIRPAPMGRAYRILRRKSHVTLFVAEKPAEAESAKKKAPAAKSASGDRKKKAAAPRAAAE